MILKLCQLIEYQMKKIFMEKSWRKSAPKGSPRPVFNFDKRTQNSYCIQEILLRIGYFERDYQKAIKNPVSFNGKDCEKQKESGTSDQWLFRLQVKFRKIPLLVMYYLTDEVSWCNIKRFLSYYKKSAIICKPIHNIVNYSTVTCPFESAKWGKEEKNLQNFFSGETKSISNSFWRAII